MKLRKIIISIAAFIGNVAIIYTIAKHGHCRETTYKAIVIFCIFVIIYCFAHILELIYISKKQSSDSEESEWGAIVKDTEIICENKDDGSCFVVIPPIDVKYVRIFNDTIYVVDDNNNVVMTVYKDVINVLSKDKKTSEELGVSDKLNVSNISKGDDNE